MMRRAVGGAVLAILASCGGILEPLDPAPVADGQDAAGSRPSMDAGDMPTDARADVPTAKPPNPVLRCTFKEGPWLIDGPTQPTVARAEVSVQNIKGERAILIGFGRLGMFRLASASPCVLESLSGFGPWTTPGSTPGTTHYAAASDGTIWRSTATTLRRESSAPTLGCTVGRGYRDEDGKVLYYLGALFLDEDGRGGWGLDGPPGLLGRLTLGTDACSVELTASPWGDLPVRANTPRDALGRLHVVDGPAKGVVGVYTATGALVSSYTTRRAAPPTARLRTRRGAAGASVYSVRTPRRRATPWSTSTTTASRERLPCR